MAKVTSFSGKREKMVIDKVLSERENYNFWKLDGLQNSIAQVQEDLYLSKFDLVNEETRLENAIKALEAIDDMKDIITEIYNDMDKENKVTVAVNVNQEVVK